MNKAVLEVYKAVDLDYSVRQAVKYFGPDFVFKATRRIRDPRLYHDEILITTGRPNHAERWFIEQAKAAGESFPIRKVQLKYVKKSKVSYPVSITSRRLHVDTALSTRTRSSATLGSVRTV